MYWNMIQWIKHGNHLGILCLVVAIGLSVGGAASLARGLQAQRAVAQTVNLGDIPRPNAQSEPGIYLGFAIPTTIKIPSIGVDSPLITVGKEADGSIGSPPKGPDFDKAAWYRESPAPGQYGASVIVGHVDSYAAGNGASVFYKLATLRPGDTIIVERGTQPAATFKVYATRQFERNKLPADQVYEANLADAELRLITCAGKFDETTDQYDSNSVIFAQLIK